jgi:hypothetical protein
MVSDQATSLMRELVQTLTQMINVIPSVSHGSFPTIFCARQEVADSILTLTRIEVPAFVITQHDMPGYAPDPGDEGTLGIVVVDFCKRFQTRSLRKFVDFVVRGAKQRDATTDDLMQALDDITEGGLVSRLNAPDSFADPRLKIVHSGRGGHYTSFQPGAQT